LEISRVPKSPRCNSGAVFGEGCLAEPVGPKVGSAGERILSSATGLFAQFGYNSVSTRDIASAAQVNEVTIFRHYPHKRDLHLAVLKSTLQQVSLRGDLLAGIAEARDGREAIVRTFQLIVQALTQKRELLRLLHYSALELSEDFDPFARRHLGQLIEVVVLYLEPWVKNGELRVANAKTVVLTLIGIVISRNSLQRVFSAEAFSLEQMFVAYTECLILDPADTKKLVDCRPPAYSASESEDLPPGRGTDPSAAP
jgi:AcrR family transcriptional regulator